jgi:hypothetical protein
VWRLGGEPTSLRALRAPGIPGSLGRKAGGEESGPNTGRRLKGGKVHALKRRSFGDAKGQLRWQEEQVGVEATDEKAVEPPVAYLEGVRWT